MKPQLYIIAGPNGAGKTTFANAYLPRFTKSREFVNADNIAQKLSPGNPEAAAIRAGREMLERIKTLANERADFSIETTPSGKSYVPWLRELKAGGYEIHLFFLWLPDVRMSINRVADRVSHGGHDIPEAVIRRRYTAGIQNLFLIYRPLLDFWSLFDNSSELPYLIAKERQKKLVVFDTELFKSCSQMAIRPKEEPLQETPDSADWMQALFALRLAKAEVIKQHLITGKPVIIWKNGRVYRQPPEEAKRALEAALHHNFDVT